MNQQRTIDRAYKMLEIARNASTTYNPDKSTINGELRGIIESARQAVYEEVEAIDEAVLLSDRYDPSVGTIYCY